MKLATRPFILIAVLVAVVVLAAGAVGYFKFLRENWVDQAVTLEITTGTAEIQRPGSSSWEAAADKMPLFAGSWIWAKEGSTVLLRFSDGSTTRVQADSMVHIDWSKSWGSRIRVVLSVARGSITNWVGKPDERGYFIVKTQTTVSRATAGIFQVDVDEQGRTAVNIKEGSVTSSALTVDNDGKLAVVLVKRSSGDTLTVPPLPKELTGQLVSELQGMLNEVVRRSVEDNTASPTVKALQATATDAASGGTVYAVSVPAGLSPPDKLPVPTPSDAGQTASISGVSGLGLDYKPVLSVPQAPATSGSSAAGSGGAPAKPVAPPSPPKFVQSIYGATGPMGVAVSPDGQRLYVTEGGGNRTTVVFDKDGKPLGSLVPPGTNASGRQPAYVAVSPQGKVYVTDRLRHVIDIYGTGREYIGTFNPGEQIATSWSPLALAFDKWGTLYVTDTTGGQHGVLAFRPSGEPAMKFGKEGTAIGEFSFPNGIAVDDKGGMYVADSNNYRIEVFSSRGEALGVLTDGGTPVGVGLARGLAIDQRERMYIVDALGHRVLVYQLAIKRTDVTPRPLFSFGDLGADDGQFSYPNGVAVDMTGRIFVTDRENDRIQVWSY